MALARFPQHYTFIGLANISGDELIYKLLDEITKQEVFCTIFTFDQLHKKDYTELLSFIQIYTTLDHRGLMRYRAIETEPTDLRLFFMTNTYNMNLAKLNSLIHQGGKSYCEVALWQVAAQLLDTMTYYNLPRTRQFGHKSTLLAAQSFPHCILRPFIILITNSFTQELDLLKLSTNQKQAALFPLLIKVVPGALTLGQVRQFQTTAAQSHLSHMAPELLLDFKEVSPSGAADIWSIGSVLYEMATGKIYNPAIDPIINLGAYSFEFQSMLRSMLSTKQFDRPTFEDLLKTERIRHVLSDIQTGTQSLISSQPEKLTLQSVELQARELLAKLPYSTTEQAQLMASWQQELPHEPNYLLGVMNMIDEGSHRCHTPTGNRFMHTSSSASQSLRSKVSQTPASIRTGKNTRYGRKMAKSPAGVQDSYTQLMQHALKDNLLKAKKAMDQVCIVFTDGTSALMLAAENNSLEVARFLVSYECCLQSKTGLTALMYAAKRGHADMVSLLLNHESMMVDSCGYTALMHAIDQGHLECIRILVKAEANYSTPTGITAGLLATKDMNDVMKQFRCQSTLQATSVSTHGTPDSKQTTSTRRSMTPSSNLSSNVNTKHQSIVEKLAIAQIVTTYEDTYDPVTHMTCLMLAVQHHSVELAQMFIHQAGCQTSKGLTALHIAVQELFVDGVTLLAPHELRYTTQYATNGFGFHRATALCLVALVGGCSDNKHTSQGHLISSQGDLGLPSRNYFRSVSQYSFSNVLSARNTTRSNKDNERAILSILNLLIPLEATYAEPGTGKTALIAAAAVGNALAVRALAKFEGGCKMIKGWTAMMCCVCRASSTTAQNLCTYIECINALAPYEQGMTSECGWTALVYASAYLNLACIEVLAPLEAEMSGETALSFLGALVAEGEMTKSEWQYSMSQARSLIVEYLRSHSLTSVQPQQQLSIGELPDDRDMKKYINNKSGLFDDESEISILEGKYFRWEGPPDSSIAGEPMHRGARASSGLYPQRQSQMKKGTLPDVSAVVDKSFAREQKSFQCQTSVAIPEQEKSYRYTFNSKPLPPLITTSPSIKNYLPILPPLNSHKIRN
ncbi:Kinase, NEK [Giardia lamblia P15]|uniref:Kinase, NEK n=1 Tax=Giardia intestinalis (strain P15) TaxID=658858 RepID=E1EYY8_GIAIA|nr:Kinase, NEK [Giardia lamblia P15]